MLLTRTESQANVLTESPIDLFCLADKSCDRVNIEFLNKIGSTDRLIELTEQSRATARGLSGSQTLGSLLSELPCSLIAVLRGLDRTKLS